MGQEKRWEIMRRWTEKDIGAGNTLERRLADGGGKQTSGAGGRIVEERKGRDKYGQ